MVNFMSKIFNNKTARWIMFGCALFIAICSLFNPFGTGSSIFFGFATALWILATMVLIAWGAIAKNETILNCGILIASPFMISAFQTGMSYVGIAFDEFDYSALYGIYFLFAGLSLLCVAAIFILWILERFFNIKVNGLVTPILLICVLSLQLLAFLFFIIAAAVENWTFGFADLIGILEPLANVVLFIAYMYRNAEVSTSEKKETKKKDNADTKEAKEETTEETTEEVDSEKETAKIESTEESDA